MKKSILFSILFFMATAVILLYSTSCEKDDAPVNMKLLYLGSPQAIDAEGNATLEFNGYCSNPDVSKIVYSVKAVAGSSSDKPTGTVVTNDDDDDDDDDDVTTKAGSTLRVISRGTGCTVLFHTDNPETFPGATIIVTATQVVFKDGRVGLFLAQSASTTATASVLPMEINPDDPDDPDDPDEPENELDQLLKKAEALEDNTFLVDDNLYTVNPETDGGYICFHNQYDITGYDIDNDPVYELYGYQIHCWNGSLHCGVEINVTVDRIGEAFEVPLIGPVTKSTVGPVKYSLWEENLYFTTLGISDQIYHSTSSNVSDKAILAERAVAKVIENEDKSMTVIAYLLAEDGTECYAKFTAFNPSYEK